jgi:carbamoyltransferase
MVLNTSFNVKGQPIVNTPEEAIETFLGTGIEFLFLENWLVVRKDG